MTAELSVRGTCGPAQLAVVGLSSALSQQVPVRPVIVSQLAQQLRNVTWGQVFFQGIGEFF